MALASCDCGHAPIFDQATPSINGRALRMIVFAMLAGFLCFCAFGTTDARAQDKQAQTCRTAADDAELADLEKELDSLQIHKALETAMKAAKERELANQIAMKEGKAFPHKYGGQEGIDRLTRKIAELDAALKENEARTAVVKARIAALKALKPCPPENKTTPAKADEPGKTPPKTDEPGKTPPPKTDEPGKTPPPAHPCRTAEDEKTLAALKAKKALYEQELKQLNKWIETLGYRYSDEIKKGFKEQAALTDKQITELERQRGVLEAEIGGLGKQIDALYALKPCVEEGKTTPGTSGTSPGTKHPKKAVKHGKHAVTEDNPLYMENYTPPPGTKTKSTAKHDDSGYAGPSRSDVPDDSNDNRTNQEQNNRTSPQQPDTTNQQPDFPVPH
jgi:hypothetical protein